jgi:hypothetical protein
MPFEGFDFTNFWDDSAYAIRNYVSEPPTDDLIAEVERELGYELPESYIWLMRQHNGGIPANTCFPTQTPTSWAEDHVAITAIMGIGRDKRYSICGDLGSQFMIDEWSYPNIGVAICDCPSAGHDMIFLDYRECGPKGEPQVVFIDQENDYKITFLADNFESFIRGLVNDEVYDTSEEDKQADLEMVKSAPFSELLATLCANSDNPAEMEQWIRGIAEEIVQENGYFVLGYGDRSYLLFDIQFWLYTHTYPETTKEVYLKEYPRMIAFGGTFSTGGYNSNSVKDWLDKRKKQGEIINKNGCLALTEQAKQQLMEKCHIYGKAQHSDGPK